MKKNILQKVYKPKASSSLFKSKRMCGNFIFTLANIVFENLAWNFKRLLFICQRDEHSAEHIAKRV